MTEILDRSKIPVPGKPKDISFPKFYESIFPNGIKLIVVEDNRSPVVTARFVFKSGSAFDSVAGNMKSGAAMMASELLTKGTSSMSATGISEEIDYHGAVLSSGCDQDASYLSLSCLKKYFPVIFDLTSSLLLDSEFSEDEFEREKKQTLNHLLSYLDEGDFLAERVFMTRLYGSSPYSNHFEGSIKSLGTLTRDDVFEFYKTYFRPNNLIIAMVGDIKAEEAENILLEKFSGWKPGNFNEPVFPDIELLEKSKVYIIKKKGAVQSDLRMGHKGINRNHKDFIPLSVMNTMLGGFFTSRINQNLREVNGYTYGARTYFNWHKNQGDFSVETNVQNNKTSSAVKEIIKEIRNMKYEKVSPEELETAKNYIIGNFPLQLETPNAVASKLIGLELYGLEKNFYNTYISRLNSVMIEDIFRVSQEYLFPENLLISAAGNPDEIKGGLEEIAEVEIIENID